MRQLIIFCKYPNSIIIDYNLNDATIVYQTHRVNYVVMKIICSITIVLFFAAMSSCDDDKQSGLPDSGTCFSGKTEREAKNLLGIVSYNVYESRWAIYVSRHGTYDSQTAGFICDELDVLKHEGMRFDLTGAILFMKKTENHLLEG